MPAAGTVTAQHTCSKDSWTKLYGSACLEVFLPYWITDLQYSPGLEGCVVKLGTDMNGLRLVLFCQVSWVHGLTLISKMTNIA